MSYRLALNVTAIPKGSLSYLTMWPAGSAQPFVSTLNALTGAVTANAAIVPAGTSGSINVYASDTTDVAININGYFAPPANGGLALYTVAPWRVVDTRLPVDLFGGPALNGFIRSFPISTGPCASPPDARAYVFNATAAPTVSLSYLTLWTGGQTQPFVSTLNAADGSVTSNLAIVPGSRVEAYTTDRSHLILDLSGYFAP